MSLPEPFYDRDGITIFNGSCLDILPLLDGATHVITDPPYSDHTHKKQWIGAALTADGAPRVGTAFTELGFDALTPEMRAMCASEFSRLVERWSLVFTDIEGVHGWRCDVQASGLDYVRTCIWDKVDSAPQFTGDRPAAAAEAIVCAHPGGKKRWNGGGSRNVFRYAVNGERGAKPHPSTKPLPLMRKLIELFTDPGDLILDPFMGSGTTLRASADLGRRAIGIEINEAYCRIAVDRLRQGVLL